MTQVPFGIKYPPDGRNQGDLVTKLVKLDAHAKVFPFLYTTIGQSDIKKCFVFCCCFL